VAFARTRGQPQGCVRKHEASGRARFGGDGHRGSAFAQDDRSAAAWDARETKLANEYLSLLVERRSYGRMIDLLWVLYAKHESTPLLLENIRAQAAQSKRPSVRLVEAHLLRKSGDVKSAAAICDEVLKAEPNNRFALRARADLADELKETDRWPRSRKKLARSLPDNDAAKPGALLDYGNMALGSGRNADAAQAWEAAAKLRPGDLDLAREVAQYLLQAGFPDRAAAFFENLTKRSRSAEAARCALRSGAHPQPRGSISEGGCGGEGSARRCSTSAMGATLTFSVRRVRLA